MTVSLNGTAKTAEPAGADGVKGFSEKENQNYLLEVSKLDSVRNIKTKAVTVRGEDALGRFIVGAGKCVNCSTTGICVKYAPASFSLTNFNIADAQNTILKDTKNRIGITCGCYAKFHRQVAHIFEKTEHRRSHMLTREDWEV